MELDGPIGTPSCRFCGAEAARQTIKGAFVYGGSPDQHFWRCASCDVIYLFPPMDVSDEERFYRSEFEKFMDSRSGTDTDWSGPDQHFRANQREVKRRMPFLEPYLRPNGKALEVGCSSGFMLSALRDRGMHVTGIDPSGVFVDYVKAKGIPVVPTLAEFAATAPPGAVDLILHYYVFEHVREPVEFIKTCMALLSDDGQMVFEVPCASEPLIELYAVEAFERFYWSIAHHWYFTKDSLARVLEASGYRFELFAEQRYDLSNHITWMRDGKPGGLGRYSAIFGDALDQSYKNRLKEQWLCDTLVAVVRRRNLMTRQNGLPVVPYEDL